MALTREQIKSLKVGDKLRIVGDPGRGFNGHGRVGEILTLSCEPSHEWLTHYDSAYLYADELTNGRFKGTIRSDYVDLVEEKNMFTKADLKPWMRVKIRKGDTYIVTGDGFLVRNGGNYLELRFYKDDLTRVEEDVPDYDIVYVYKSPHLVYEYLDPTRYGTLLWERIEETEAQKQYKALQKKMKEVQEEMDKLQPLV